MMLTARFQAARLQPAMRCSMQRRGALQVVAFKNGDEEQQQVQKQEMSKTKVTFQLPLHGEHPAAAPKAGPACFWRLGRGLLPGLASSRSGRTKAELTCCGAPAAWKLDGEEAG